MYQAPIAPAMITRAATQTTAMMQPRSMELRLGVSARRAHLDLAVAHAHIEATRRECRRSVYDVTILERELRLVPWTLNRIADELSFRERTAEMRTGVAQSEDAIASLDQHDGNAVRFDAHRLLLMQRGARDDLREFFRFLVVSRRRMIDADLFAIHQMAAVVR